MSRKLEKFISDNRNEFDDAQPSGTVWEKIAAGIETPKTKRVLMTPFIKWSLAAALLVSAGLAVYILAIKKTAATGSTEVVKVDTFPAGDPLTAEYGPEVNEFAKLVALKQQELKTLAPEQPELYNQFTQDMNQLDSSYKALKNQLSVSPNREMLIEAMIQNLQLQLNVLNQQLTIIHQIKASKKV